MPPAAPRYAPRNAVSSSAASFVIDDAESNAVFG